MTQPPQEFLDLLPKIAAGPVEGPVYWLWVYDPQTATVQVEHNEGRPRANALTHEDLAERVQSPDRLHGFAYPILGGYRLTDEEHRPLGDPFVANAVIKAIKGDHTPTPSDKSFKFEGRVHYGRPMQAG